MTFFTLFHLCAMAWQPQGAPGLIREWVVKEIVAPPMPQAGEISAWTGFYPITDIDRDGAVDSYRYAEYTVNGASQSHAGWESGFVAGWPFSGGVSDRYPFDWDAPFSETSEVHAVLRRPDGYTAVSRDFVSHGIAFHDLLSQSLLGLHTGQGREGWGFRRAGDQNQDGYDDLFAWSQWSGQFWDYLLDGRTFQLIWQRAYPSGSFPYPMTAPSEPHPGADFDLDGGADHMMFQWETDIHPAGGHRLRVLRGFDGRLLWEHTCAQPVAASSCTTGLDVNFDGVPDALLRVAADRIECVSGADGGLLWQFPQAVVSGGTPSGYSPGFVSAPIWLTRSVVERGGVDACIVVTARPPGSVFYHNLVAHFNAQLGALAGIYLLPETQSPWFPEFMQGTNQHGVTCIGDLDRDGLKEIAMTVRAPNDEDSYKQHQPNRMAILGLKTWFVAAEARIGDSLIGSLSIPIAPDHRFVLLMSTGFDRDGGARIAAWKTHLVADALYAHTLTQQPYTGRLDVDGRGTVGFTVPSVSGLIGKTLYSKVAVLKPGVGGEVWTLSTLGQTRIVP